MVLLNQTEAVIACFRQHGDGAQRTLIHASLSSAWFQEACLAIARSELNTSTKRWAFEALAMMPGPRCARLAKQGLQAPAMTIRLHVVVGIASGIFPDRINWLFASLSDVSGGIRVNALAALLHLRPIAIRRHLPRLLQDDKHYIRRMAQVALSRSPTRATG